MDNQDKEKEIKKTPTTLDETESFNEETYEERVERLLKNNPAPPCTRNKELDEKINKYGVYATAILFLVGICFALFQSAKFRSPYSFLFFFLATLAMSVSAYLRYKNNKKCNCSLCETQGKTLLNSAIIWFIVSICALAAAITFFILN